LPPSEALPCRQNRRPGRAAGNAGAPSSPKQYFTREEAAEYLRMSVARLDKLAARGDIRRARLGDGVKPSVLFRKRDLDAFVESHLESI
jgi:excisionase family DNA binding protein